jgi:hypothetical protein
MTFAVSMLSSSARFQRIEHRRLPGRHDVPRPAHRRGGVDCRDLAGDEPVEQMTNRGEPLLDARRRELARPGLDPGGDVQRLHLRHRLHAGMFAPGQKIGHGAAIRAARVRVADLGGEKFEEADAGAVAGGVDQGREGVRADRNELVHGIPLFPSIRSRMAFANTLIPSIPAQTKTIALLRRRMSGAASRSSGSSGSSGSSQNDRKSLTCASICG